MRTPQDDTPEYTESVKQAILAFDPDLTPCNIDEHALDLTSCYLWWNGYKTDETITPTVYASSTDRPLGIDSNSVEPAYVVYDVLAWVEGNT